MTQWLAWLAATFDAAQQWLFEGLVQPLLFHLGMASVLEDAYAATGWLLVGLVQLAVMVAVIAPLERWRPVEPVHDRAAVRTDVLYTLVHRLGLFRLALFFTVDPLWDAAFGALRVHGWHGMQLDALWPGVTDRPLASLLLYLLAFDLLDYCLHRAQHRFDWWWRLHSLHHSQRQMTLWSDNRNHLLDDLLRDAIVVLAAQCIGVAPGQFVAIVAITQLSESLQHANLRAGFGRLGGRLWVSPRFHRRHHAIEPVAAAVSGAPVPYSCNYGVLLPWWDMLLGTADFSGGEGPTGVLDQVVPGRNGRLRDYGRGFWQQQWRGLLRLAGRA
ncbi:Sterol desaturase/sphingolipid hydroxylase, fatty acid hydroxylase superfamily [Oryzisolibacter propanilivorax]|uniref:Sterol desaturase/sphingolipid hydroxylase, fatty acid hydroxylase superfamily n=1 Tax=Oryzisolibacter propanilivorax TaxID=1527607 RepID=A0A1G9NU28_9BURK|nr:sterol desaturase family protein [Oryzisolibacter propanilivorax]SDL90098.1 Sterol desaturase/sphingolipid hydroxylase, fatty acid hydroxylase superfamily [Oryzisolibacter propanilivorax]